jgi:hypothetical protein
VRTSGCFKFYDYVCRAEGFDLLLTKGCDRIAALTPCKWKHYEAFDIYQLDSCFCLIRDVAEKLTHASFRRQFLADTRASKLIGKDGKDNKVVFVIKFLEMSDKNDSVVNIEFTWIKYIAFGKSVCTFKKRYSIERIIVSKTWIKQLHTLPVLHFNRCLTTEYSEITAHFNGNFDTDNQIYVP